MLIRGSISSKKTDMLIEQYSKLLNSGVLASEILVIVQNSKLKNKFVESTLNQLTVQAVEHNQLIVAQTFVDTGKRNWSSTIHAISIGSGNIGSPRSSGTFKNKMRTTHGNSSHHSILHGTVHRRTDIHLSFKKVAVHCGIIDFRIRCLTESMSRNIL